MDVERGPRHRRCPRPRRGADRAGHRRPRSLRAARRWRGVCAPGPLRSSAASARRAPQTGEGVTYAAKLAADDRRLRWSDSSAVRVAPRGAGRWRLDHVPRGPAEGPDAVHAVGRVGRPGAARCDDGAGSGAGPGDHRRRRSGSGACAPATVRCGWSGCSRPAVAADAASDWVNGARPVAWARRMTGRPMSARRVRRHVVWRSRCWPGSRTTAPTPTWCCRRCSTGPGWPPTDRGFVTDLVYGTLRRRACL